MAKGRKSYTLDEKLKMINEQIDEYAEKLQSLKEQKKMLETEIHNAKLNELYELVIASGKTIEEVKLMLS